MHKFSCEALETLICTGHQSDAMLSCLNMTPREPDSYLLLIHQPYTCWPLFFLTVFRSGNLSAVI